MFLEGLSTSVGGVVLPWEKARIDRKRKDASPPQNEKKLDGATLHALFEVSPVRTSQEFEEYHRLRYQVFVTENGFEDPTDHPGGLEKDEFDDRSLHTLVRHRETGIPVGCVRMILPNLEDPSQSFSVQKATDEDFVRRFWEYYPVSSTVEVSRLSWSKERLRSAAEICGEKPKALVLYAFPAIILGAMRMSREAQASHWLLCMEPSFLRLASRNYAMLHPQETGSIVEYHGRRQPISCELSSMIQKMRRDGHGDVVDILLERAPEKNNPLPTRIPEFVPA